MSAERDVRTKKCLEPTIVNTKHEILRLSLEADVLVHEYCFCACYSRLGRLCAFLKMFWSQKRIKLSRRQRAPIIKVVRYCRKLCYDSAVNVAWLGCFFVIEALNVKVCLGCTLFEPLSVLLGVLFVVGSAAGVVCRDLDLLRRQNT